MSHSSAKTCPESLKKATFLFNDPENSFLLTKTIMFILSSDLPAYFLCKLVLNSGKTTRRHENDRVS